MTDQKTQQDQTIAQQTAADAERFPHIHDPAIIPENGRFLIMGTHRRYAVSQDLLHWTRLGNNLTRTPREVLLDAWNSWPASAANLRLEENTWAPDCIWNPVMHKWCQYLSINGGHYVSMIVLLTADDPESDWTYVGPVIYSGFSGSTASRTDVPRVLGKDADLTRYQSLTDTRINAIDASLAVDEHERLWMTFGSWFGGVWMIRLDPATGLRDYSATYPLEADRSDPYYGIKLAGGHWVSGEGSYLRKIGDWWYLFLAYGELMQRGGYQIRLFRSKSITGPYADMAGRPAIVTHPVPKNWETDRGLRLLGSWAWQASATDGVTPQGPGFRKLPRIEVSQGHNSVLGPGVSAGGIDPRAAFLVYHTRFADLEPSTRYSNGHDYYEARVRELVTTPSGWLAAVPFLYQGVSSHDAASAISHGDLGEIPGTYDILAHDPVTSYDGSIDEDGSLHGINLPATIRLDTDGSVRCGSADGSDDGSAATGRWSACAACDGDAAAFSLGLDGKILLRSTVRGTHAIPTGSYSGRIMRLPDETADLEHFSAGRQRLCWTAAGANLCLWGAKVR